MEAISAMESDPSKVMIPAAAQAAKTSVGEPRSKLIPDTFLKTPDPIMEEITKKITPMIPMDLESEEVLGEEAMNYALVCRNIAEKQMRSAWL